MHVQKKGLVGATVLLLAAGVATASRSYAANADSPHAARTQVIKAVEVNNHYVFSPARDTVKLGSTVKWVNRTDAPHTVTFAKAGMLDKMLGQGKTVSFTPKKAGVYQYRCTYHAGMTGTLVVTK